MTSQVPRLPPLVGPDEGVTPARTEPVTGGGSEASVLRAVKSVGAIVAPTTLVTALLFYFGWARTNAQANYLGLDATTLGYSNQDYLLRSISSVLLPAGEVLVVGLLCLWADAAVGRRIDQQRNLGLFRVLVIAAAGVGAVLLAVGVAGLNDHGPVISLRVLPLLFLVGIGLVGYAVHLHRRLAGADASRPSGEKTLGSLPSLSSLLVAVLLAMALVWEVANYADSVGRGLGRRMMSQPQLASRPDVVVYSPKRLHIEAAGVTETAFAEPDSAYGFRYSGLKLLFRSGGKYFLVPASWTPDHGVNIVLPDVESMRIEFIRTSD
jgi:hypothetical protein